MCSSNHNSKTPLKELLVYIQFFTYSTLIIIAGLGMSTGAQEDPDIVRSYLPASACFLIFSLTDFPLADTVKGKSSENLDPSAESRVYSEPSVE